MFIMLVHTKVDISSFSSQPVVSFRKTILFSAHPNKWKIISVHCIDEASSRDHALIALSLLVHLSRVAIRS